MTSDTHGPTFSILAGVLKRKRYSTAKYRMSPLKMVFTGGKSQRARYKNKYPVTLPDRPFNWKDDDQ